MAYYNSNPYDQYNSISPEELGRIYEKCVARFMEQKYECIVVPQGHMLGLKDGGIDLVGISKDCVYLVQCKYYRDSRVIHENIINQLGGSAKTFAYKYPLAKSIVPVLAYSCRFDYRAFPAVEANGVICESVEYQQVRAQISTNKTIEDLGINIDEYENRLMRLIASIQSDDTRATSDLSSLFVEIMLAGKENAAIKQPPESASYDLKSNEDRRKPYASFDDYLPPAGPLWLFIGLLIHSVVALCAFFVTIEEFVPSELLINAFGLSGGVAAIGSICALSNLICEWNKRIDYTKKHKRKRDK